jgi:predicted nucleotidyltransferase
MDVEACAVPASSGVPVGHRACVPDAVRSRVALELDRIEAEQDVKILFACESGSRAWGFESSDSDYDVRFFYVRRLAWHLSLELSRDERRDVIERPIVDAYDVNGWELTKALVALRKGSASVSEWLRSPIVYRADPDFAARMHGLVDAFHQPDRAYHHYLHMARNNFREYLQGEEVRLKKYLYVLRPLMACKWIESGLGPAPVEFDRLVAATIVKPALRTEIDALLAFKRSDKRIEMGPRMPEIHAFLLTELQRLVMTAPAMREAIDFTPLNAMLMGEVLRFERERGGFYAHVTEPAVSVRAPHR